MKSKLLKFNITYQYRKLSSSTCRDVFIIDNSFHPQPSHEDIHLMLKHPNSSHVIAKYSTTMFQNSSYTFNQLGEYSLNMSAAFELKLNINHLTDINRKCASNSNTHDLIIWSDNLYYKDLSLNHVNSMAKLFTNDELILLPMIEKIINSESKLSQVSTITDLMIFLSVSPSLPAKHSQSLTEWFTNSFNALQKYQNSQFQSIRIFQTEMMRNHRLGTNIMILPTEDCFEFVSTPDKVHQIIKKCLLIDS